MQKQYPEYHAHLQQLIGQLSKQIPGTMSAFVEMHRDAVADGVLSARVKELMALAISIVVRCDGCISYHVHDAFRAGATTEEIQEAVGVAVLMGGGPAGVYGAEALEAVDQFEAQAASAGGR